MPIKLVIEIVLFVFFLTLLIVYLVQRNLINIKYSLVWILALVIVLLSSIIPGFLSRIAILLGFELMSNFVFTLMIAILIFVMISLTIIVSRQKDSLRLLIQEVSILKAKIESKE